MKKTGWIIIIALLVINTVAIAWLYMGNPTKTAYIDYNIVYNNCKLKLSLEKDLQRVTNLRKAELDSMQLELSFQSESIKNGKASQETLDTFEETKNRFFMLQTRYEEENMRLKETYSTQIRKEINEKSRQFAESRGYAYLFAAMGDGAIMYGSPSEDVTAEFRKFLDN